MRVIFTQSMAYETLVRPLAKLVLGLEASERH